MGDSPPSSAHFDDEDSVNLATDITWFGVETAVLAMLVVLILRRYISFTDTDKSVYFGTLVGYFFAFATIFLMPVDIAVVRFLVN